MGSQPVCVDKVLLARGHAHPLTEHLGAGQREETGPAKPCVENPCRLEGSEVDIGDWSHHRAWDLFESAMKTWSQSSDVTRYSL